MDNPASDGFREGVRQGNALDHLSAIGMHFRLFIVALVGRSSRPIGDGSAKGPRSAPVGILVPTGSLKESWDFLVMILILYSAISIPVRVSFDAEANGAMWVFEVVISILFLVDVILAFSTAYQNEEGEMVYDRGSIARHYLCGWFWIDAPSAVPVELIEYTHALGYVDADNLATLRFLRMFRLFRLLRLLKIKEYITRIEEAFMINLRILKLVEIFVKLGFIAHILGWSVLQDLTHIYAYTSCAWPSRPP